MGDHAGLALGELGQLAVEGVEALLRRGVGLLGQRHLLDLELADAALDDVDLGRHRVDLDAQPAGGLVDEVDGLVGQEAAGEVAVGEHGGGDEGGVLDAHAVVDLVALLEAAEDGDGVLDRRLADEHRLEAALEGGVLLDVGAVLVERGGADEAQLAAGEHRLDHVAGVHGALGLAGADDGVELVDEGDDLAAGVGDLLEHGLEPLLELAAVLGAGDHRAEVEADEALVLQALGHVALDDAPGEALDDGGLADAGLADEHRVVLGAAGQHLDDPADLLVAADDRVELALAGGLGEVAAVLLEGLVAVLGVLAGDPVAAPHLRRAASSSSRLTSRPARPGRAGGARWRGTRRRARCARASAASKTVLQGAGEPDLGAVGLGQLGRRPRRRRCAARAAGLPTLVRTGSTTPSSWRSRAARRWSGVTSGFDRRRGQLGGGVEGLLGLDRPAVRVERHGRLVYDPLTYLDTLALKFSLARGHRPSRDRRRHAH